jgi:protein-tyrosine-phosphatase
MKTTSPAEEADLKRRINLEARRLHQEFAGTFAAETIDRYIEESALQLEQARVKDFIPMFVRRFARDRLRALAQAEGLLSKDVPEVLYVCVQNAGRSQMAAALTAWLGGDRVHVRSAGSDPGDEVNPAVVEAMAELGLDLSEEFPKPLTDEVVRAADAVITMGCGDACPVYPGSATWTGTWTTRPNDPCRGAAHPGRIRERVARLLTELEITISQPR